MTDANVAVTLLKKRPCGFESSLEPEKNFLVFFPVVFWLHLHLNLSSCHYLITTAGHLLPFNKLSRQVSYTLPHHIGTLGGKILSKFAVLFLCNMLWIAKCCIRDWQWKQLACSRLYVQAVLQVVNIAIFCSCYLYSVVLNSLQQIGAIFLCKPPLSSSKFVIFLSNIYDWFFMGFCENW